MVCGQRSCAAESEKEALTLSGFLITIVGIAPQLTAEQRLMTIPVLDQANLRPSKIKNMEDCVKQKLTSIKVDVKWVDCASNSAACQKPAKCE